MKISVCGKGGTGKSTIVTLLAQELSMRGQEVLIIDADESNYGLHKHLGMEMPEDFIEYVGGKLAFFNSSSKGEASRKAFMDQYFSGLWHLSDIPQAYYTEKDSIKLMCSGKIRAAGEGCACPFHAVLKNFVSHLELSDRQVAILDMEAGIEHFGRGIDEEMDLIFVLCDPSYESVQMAQRIATLSQKPVFYILNKMDGDTEAIVRDRIEKKERIACTIPANEDILKAGLSGSAITLTIPQISKIADIVTA